MDGVKKVNQKERGAVEERSERWGETERNERK
jgi:hypothetical protein